MANHKILVYGTLRQGNGNHDRLLPGMQYDELVTVKGYRMHGTGGFPYTVPVDDESSTIVGEIYTVDDAQLAALDRLEGVPHHYQRLPVKGLDGVEIYIPARGEETVKHIPVIESGDWNKHIGEFYQTRTRWY